MIKRRDPPERFGTSNGFGVVKKPDGTVVWPEEWNLQQKSNYVAGIRAAFGPETIAFFGRALEIEAEKSSESIVSADSTQLESQAHTDPA